MFYQSQKMIQWKGRDHVRAIGLFAMHTVILFVLFTLAEFCTTQFNPELTAKELFLDGNWERTLYIAIALLLVVVGTYLYFYSEQRDFLYKAGNVNMLFVIIELGIAIAF
ncbi:MAG: hypothetical protein J5903_00760, partial [Clostridia bacterium]|nr:hypothetical protein [Clostridia bacterium]